MYSFVSFILFYLVIINVNAFDYDRSFLAEVKPKISEQCYRDLVKADKNLREFIIHAVSVWNAKTPGLLNGSHDYTGNYAECLGSDSNPVVMQYCVVEVGISYEGETPVPCYKRAYLTPNPCSNELRVPNHRLKWALCAVSSCSESYLRVLAEVLLQKSDIGRSGLTYEVSVTKSACQTSATVPFHTDAILFFCLVGAVAAVVTICTIRHWSCKTRDPKLQASALVRKWSLIEPLSSLTEISSDDIKIFHSMRAISTFTVVLLHEHVSLSHGPMANLHTFYQALAGMRYFRGDLVVDTFFAMTGFIFVINFFTSRSRSFLEHLCTRYFRIMPVFALIIFYVISVMEYTSHGPFWPSIVSAHRNSCRANWWLGVLMLGNYGAWEDHCWPVSWSLPCDFHFLIVGILICSLIKRNEKLGLAALSALMVAALVVLATSIVSNQRVVLPPHVDDSIRKSQMLGWFMEIYIRSHFRISSYLIGMLGGYTCVLNQKKTVISQWTSIVGILLGMSMMTTMFVSGLFYGEEYPYNPWKAALYGTLVRPMWSLGFIIFTLVLIFGYVPLLSEFFNMRIWIPFSKISYSMYLVHMIFVYRRIGFRVQPFVYVPGDIAHFAGSMLNLGLILIFALLTYLCVERPFYGLFKITLEAYRNRKKAKLE